MAHQEVLPFSGLHCSCHLLSIQYFHLSSHIMTKFLKCDAHDLLQSFPILHHKEGVEWKAVSPQQHLKWDQCKKHEQQCSDQTPQSIHQIQWQFDQAVSPWFDNWLQLEAKRAFFVVVWMWWDHNAFQFELSHHQPQQAACFSWQPIQSSQTCLPPSYWL